MEEVELGMIMVESGKQLLRTGDGIGNWVKLTVFGLRALATTGSGYLASREHFEPFSRPYTRRCERHLRCEIEVTTVT